MHYFMRGVQALSLRYGVVAVSLLLLLTQFSCTAQHLRLPASVPEGPVRITLLHLNDVYEITPINGRGGLARIATLKKQLLQENPNTFAFLAGDLLSPSALGLARVDGEPLAGRQMIETVNLFLDYMTFGNHEFDLPESQLRQRLAESKFTWVSSNVFDTHGQPFPAVHPNAVFEVRAGDRRITVGVLALTLDMAKRPWITYNTDLVGIARQQAQDLRAQGADIVLALTHLTLSDDILLAEQVPEIDLILGGHDHENMHVRRGSQLTPICKADANARTVYIHRLTYDPVSQALDVDSQLRVIDDSLEDDSETAAVVRHWVDQAFAAFRREGMHAEAVVTTPTVELDGREGSIRQRETRLTQILARALLDLDKDAVASVYNSGTIRLDDTLQAGQPINEYDILRMLPFPGQAALVEMRGDLLTKVLRQGEANRGTGGFLHYGNIVRHGQQWRINGTPLDPQKRYKVSLTDFLLTGREAGLEFLKPPTDGMTVLNRQAGDLRKALAERLQKEFETSTATDRHPVLGAFCADQHPSSATLY